MHEVNVNRVIDVSAEDAWSILDDFGVPVSGAFVAVEISRDGRVIESDGAVTDVSGWVTFGLRNARSGTYTTIITDVDASPLIWDGSTPINTFSK